MFYTIGFAIIVLHQRSIAPSAAQTYHQEQQSVINQKASTQVKTEERLASDNVRCIDANRGNIWVGTDRGVSIFHEADNRWTKLDREDGLISDDVTDIAVDNTIIWIGTRIGLNGMTRKLEHGKNFRSVKV